MQRSTLARLALASALALAATLTVGAPAQAAEPKCDSFSTQHLQRLGTAIYVPATDAAYESNTNCSLSFGDGFNGKNWGVVGLQRTLNYCFYGYMNERFPQYSFGWLEDDGIFGPNTKDALIQVQLLYHLKADGGYGPQTRSILRYWNGSSSMGPTGEERTYWACDYLAP